MQVAISGLMNMYMYELVIVFFSSYRLPGPQRIGSVFQCKLSYAMPGVKTYYPNEDHHDHPAAA